MSGKCWSRTRPEVLVIACSDGRLQESIDDFLHHHLGITYYDRLYAPGGPGAISDSGCEFLRSNQFRRECDFLIEAHGTKEVILIFHAPAADGPDDATCADYRRKMPRRTPAEIREQQVSDLPDLLRAIAGNRSQVRCLAYRAEVTTDSRVRFVDLAGR